MYESIPSLRFGLCSLRCSTKENTNPFLDSLEYDMNVLGLYLRIVGCTTPNLKTRHYCQRSATQPQQCPTKQNLQSNICSGVLWIQKKCTILLPNILYYQWNNALNKITLHCSLYEKYCFRAPWWDRVTPLLKLGINGFGGRGWSFTWTLKCKWQCN